MLLGLVHPVPTHHNAFNITAECTHPVTIKYSVNPMRQVDPTVQTQTAVS